MKTSFPFALLFLFAAALANAQENKVSMESLEKEEAYHSPVRYCSEGKPFSGIASEYYPKEGIRLDYYIEDGWLVKQLGWDNKGAKEREFHYRKGLPHGKFIVYYENGQKFFEETYVDGQLQGKQYGWYSDGSPRLETEYANGAEAMRFEYPAPEGVLELPRLPGC